jgi:hypothetical protein
MQKKTEYLQYLQLAEDKLHSGSAVFADKEGIFADQMSDYLDYVRKSGKYQKPLHSSWRRCEEITIKLFFSNLRKSSDHTYKTERSLESLIFQGS